MSLLFNRFLIGFLPKFVIAFPPRSKCLLTSWLQSPSTVILEPKKIKSVAVSIFPHFVLGCWLEYLTKDVFLYRPPFFCSLVESLRDNTWNSQLSWVCNLLIQEAKSLCRNGHRGQCFSPADESPDKNGSGSTFSQLLLHIFHENNLSCCILLKLHTTDGCLQQGRLFSIFIHQGFVCICY